MKLKIIKNGKEEYLEVSFWSFVKCYVLAMLVLNAIGFGIMIIFFIVLS